LYNVFYNINSKLKTLLYFVSNFSSNLIVITVGILPSFHPSFIRKEVGAKVQTSQNTNESVLSAQYWHSYTHSSMNVGDLQRDSSGDEKKNTITMKPIPEMFSKPEFEPFAPFIPMYNLSIHMTVAMVQAIGIGAPTLNRDPDTNGLPISLTNASKFCFEMSDDGDLVTVKEYQTKASKGGVGVGSTSQIGTSQTDGNDDDNNKYYALNGSIFTDFINVVEKTKFYEDMLDDIGGDWNNPHSEKWDYSNEEELVKRFRGHLNKSTWREMVNTKLLVGQHEQFEYHYDNFGLSLLQKHPLFWLLMFCCWNEECGITVPPFVFQNFRVFFIVYNTEFLARVLAIMLTSALYPRKVIPMLQGIDVTSSEKKFLNIFTDTIDSVIMIY